MAIKDTFLAGILAHVPEADRGKAEAAIEGLEGNGLRQSEFSKLSDEAAKSKQRFDELYTKNTEWWEANKDRIAEADALRAKVTELEAKGGGDGHEKPFKLPDNLVTKADMEVFERGAVGFMSTAVALANKHLQDFGQILNIDELLLDPQVQKVGLLGVYQTKFKAQIDAKQKAADDAKAEALREEGRTSERARLAGHQSPYPVVGNEPSSLDAIEAARSGDKPAVKSLEEMTAEYARLGSTRAGAGSAA